MTRIVVNTENKDLPFEYEGVNHRDDDGLYQRYRSVTGAIRRVFIEQAPLPQPLAVADFAAGTYNIGGVNKTFAEMFIDDVNYPLPNPYSDPTYLPAGRGDPYEIVPGEGLGGSRTGTGLNFYLHPTAELLAALPDINDGLTVVYDGFMDQTGTRHSAVIVRTEQWGGVPSEGRYTGIGCHNPSPPYFSLYDYSSDYPDRDYPGFTDHVNGDSRIAATLSQRLLALSINGAPAKHVRDPIHMSNLDTLYLFVQVATNGARTGTGTGFMRRISFYPTQTKKVLQRLSVVKPSMYQGDYYYGYPPIPDIEPKPFITGTTALGDQLTANTGIWTGFPDSYTFQWKRNGANIPDATNSNYIIVGADSGTNITVEITATNDSGSSSETTASVAIS